MKPRRIVISYNTSWYIWNFRMPLIAALQERGYEVLALAPEDEYSARIVAAGVPHRSIQMDAKGRNPLRDAAAVFAFLKAYRELEPDVVLQYTIKPNIYGSIAARVLGIPAINNITGLGAAFESGGMLKALVRSLYRFAFSRVERVFFQNPDDRELFVLDHLVKQSQAGLLPGSGVDLVRYAPCQRPEGAFTFLYVGRLLRAKGVEDLVSAARAVKRALPESRIVLLGKRDDEDPGAANPKILDDAIAEGIVEHAGIVDDVRPFLAAADCVVLPSYYREGTPRSLLEAAAMGRPLVAADSAGTREPVVDGENGFLCRPRDPADLAEKMLAFAALPAERRAAMGAASRRIAESRFDERIVIHEYLEAIAAIAPLSFQPDSNDLERHV